MMREYEFTDEEFRTILAALRHARDEAVHPDSAVAFSNARGELERQYEHADPHKATESERLGGGDDAE